MTYEEFDKMFREYMTKDRFYEYNNAVYKSEAGFPGVTHVWNSRTKQWERYTGDAPAHMEGDSITQEEAESW